MDIKTCKCGTDINNNFFLKKNGNHTGLYCSNCGRWQKWLDKNEIRVFEHLIEVRTSNKLK